MNKFIIVKNNKEGFIMRFANTDFHKNLVYKDEIAFGGGMFTFSDDNLTMTLYGKSEDFGKPKWRDVKESKQKIHIDEDLNGVTIRWLSGYDDEWQPIYLDFTDMFAFDYF